MGKQHHDTGWKKQQPAAKPEAMPDTNKLALQLVSRGLASPQILEFRNAPARKKT